MGKPLSYFNNAIKDQKPVPLFVLRLPEDRNKVPGVCLISHKIVPLLSDKLTTKERRRWLFIDTVQGYGYPENNWSDLHMLGDPRLKGKYLKSDYSNIPYTTIDDGGDFVDPNLFYENKDSIIRYDIVMVASWAYFKNHMLLLEALRLLKSKGKNLSVLIIGSYCVPGHMSSFEEVRKYEEKIRVSTTKYELDITFKGGRGSVVNIDNSVSLGIYSKKEICKFINMAHIGVLTSLREGTPRFAAECLLCNKPLILLKDLKGGARKYINKNTGLLVANDPTDLAQAFCKLLEMRSEMSPRNDFMRKYGNHNTNMTIHSSLVRIDPSLTNNYWEWAYSGDLWGGIIIQSFCQILNIKNAYDTTNTKSQTVHTSISTNT